MKYARRRDENEPAIVAALKSIGAHVQKLDGHGTPDLCVQYRGRWFMVEVKQPVETKLRSAAHKGALTAAQSKWWSECGPMKPLVVTTPDEAVQKLKDAAGATWMDSAGQEQPLEVVP